MKMEQKILLHPKSSDFNVRPNPFAKLEPNYPWVRYVVNAAAVASIIGIVIFVLILAIPIAMLVIGARYRHFLYCPIEPRLSMFLIVGGSILFCWIILTIALSLVTMFVAYKRLTVSVIAVGITSVLIVLIEIFLIIWLIVGSVWTFGIRNRVQNIINYPFNFPVYCDKTLYQATSAFIIILYIFFALQICVRIAISVWYSKRK